MFPADCAQQEVYTGATGSAAPKDPPISTQVPPIPQVQIPHLPHTMAPGVCSLMQHKSTLQPTGNAQRKYPSLWAEETTSLSSSTPFGKQKRCFQQTA